MCIKCANCGEELTEIYDTTYANYNSEKTAIGQHTGNIYRCHVCDSSTIEDLLNGLIRIWVY